MAEKRKPNDLLTMLAQNAAALLRQRTDADENMEHEDEYSEALIASKFNYVITKVKNGYSMRAAHRTANDSEVFTTWEDFAAHLYKTLHPTPPVVEDPTTPTKH